MESLNDIFKNIAETEAKEKIINIKTAAQVNGVPSRCEDQFVAIIEITKEKVVYVENDFSKRKNSKEYENQRYLDTIALVLESPHKEEFKNIQDIAPAKGTTGKNIEAMLLGILAKYIYINDIHQHGAYSLTNSKIKHGKYKLLLINAVQYQCSLGSLSGEKYKKRRDDIFSEMFSNQYVKTDFKERLEIYNPKIIINCCTGGEYRKVAGLQKLVQNEKEETIHLPVKFRRCSIIIITNFSALAPRKKITKKFHIKVNLFKNISNI